MRMRPGPVRQAPAHVMQLRVYYEDTDAAGIVYYANYLKFAERGRTEMLRGMGFGQERLRAESGIGFAVRRCAAEYLSPARLDDVLTVETGLDRLGAASFEMAQAIRREGRLLAILYSTIACLDADGRPVRIPAVLREAFAALAATPGLAADPAADFSSSMVVPSHGATNPGIAAGMP